MTTLPLSFRYLTPEVRKVVYPFEGRVSVNTTSHIIKVDLSTNRVILAPLLAARAQPEDVALWIIAARNLLLVQSVVGSLATTDLLRKWEFAWCLAQAASVYNLPRTTPALFYSPDGSLIERVLSLQWNRLLEFHSPRIKEIPKAAHSYTEWMDLGKRLLVNTPPSKPSKSTEQHSEDASIDNILEVGGIPNTPSNPQEDERMVRIVQVDIPVIQWALETVTIDEHNLWRKLPSMQIVRGLATIQPTDITHVDYRLGHVGRREVIRDSMGIPTFYGKVEYSVEESWVVYADVSGSMDQYMGMIWSIAQSIGADHVYVFSTKIHEVTVGSHYVPSTGGTNYNIVLDHINDHQYANVVIFSDETESLQPKKTTTANIVYLRAQDPTKTGNGFDRVASKIIQLLE